MTGVSIIEFGESATGASILQFTETTSTITRAENRATILQGVENVGPPGDGTSTASFVVLGTSTALSNERVLTAGTGIDLTDAGAGSTITVDVDPSEFGNGTVPIASLASEPVLIAGSTMTGLLTLTRASASDIAQIVKLAADTQGRYRIAANGQQYWDPSGAAATAPIYNAAYVGGGTGLLIYGFDSASITSGSAAGFQIVAARGAHPHLLLTALNGPGSAPTQMMTGDTLGEIALQGQYGSTVGQIITGAAMVAYAVEDWTLAGGTGGAWSVQTRPRGPGYAGIRVESLLIFDSGQIQMDPGDARGGGVTWTLPNSRLRVVSQSATERTLVLKAHASQSENIQEWRSSAETVLASVDETGAGSFATGSTVGGDLISVEGHPHDGAVTAVFDGAGAAIAANTECFVRVPYDATIDAWTVLADQAGDIVVDVWKDNYASFPPTVLDSIAGTEKPTLTAATKAQDTSLSSWGTSLAAGDILLFHVDSATTVEKVMVQLHLTRT